MEKDIKLVEQIATFKRLPKSDSRWRVAFYYIAKEFWDLEEVFVIIDKALYEEQGLKIPVFREYKEAEGFQIFSSHIKAKDFVEKQGDLFVTASGEKLIGRIRQGAFREVFVPFFAEQNFNYLLNEDEALFADTFKRLLAIMEASENYIVDEEQGLKIPVFREYKEAEGFQIFSSHIKAKEFVEKQGDLFVTASGEKLIGRIRQGAFREVFVPFFAEQNFNYLLNEDEALFADTFKRLLAVMEASENYIVDEEQEAMLKAGDVQSFFADICKKYIVLV